MYSFLPEGNRRMWILATHTSGWIAFMSYMFIANKLTSPDINAAYTLLSVIPYLMVFYANIFWLERYRKLRLLYSVLSFILTFFALSLLAYLYLYYLLPYWNIRLFKTGQLREFVKYALLGYIQFYAFALLYFVAKEFIRKARNLRTIEREKYEKELENAGLKEQELKGAQEKLKMEYAFLKAQVNPHFLHNTLNTLYSQALTFSNDLAGNIAKLSKMMRYSFETIEEGSDLVPVLREYKNLQRLIEINDIRFEGQEKVSLRVEGDMNGHWLPPLSLITIAENAFKYGDLADPDFPLRLSLSIKPGLLHFTCINKVSLKHQHDTSHRLGLDNLQKRLELLFPGTYRLTNRREQDLFIAELIIKS